MSLLSALSYLGNKAQHVERIQPNKNKKSDSSSHINDVFRINIGVQLVIYSDINEPLAPSYWLIVMIFSILFPLHYNCHPLTAPLCKPVA